MDLIVIASYMAAMIGIGWFAKRRAQTESDYLVAGRRLGPLLYAATMAALVMGGGATVGGIGLGYQYGLGGAWLVFAMAFGVVLVSAVLAPLINRLRVYTVSQMLELRYGEGKALVSGIVMLAYTLMISVTSTIAYGAIFSVLFDIGKIPSILIGSGVVILYSAMGGMWSITLTDFVQFVLKTISIFCILLPITIWRAGGFAGLSAHLPAAAFSFTDIGAANIFTYLVLYVPTMVIGQDLWQRVFTARNDRVARWAGVGAGIYCFLYGLAGASIGMAAKVLLPDIAARDQVYTQVVRHVLPQGLSGLVVAGALAAIMSTSSGALIATATVAKEDILRPLRRRATASVSQQHEIRSSRRLVVFFGVVMAGIACALHDVIAALTIASDILVGGLLVAVIGGMLWKRATALGAMASIVGGTVVTLGTMAVLGDVYANLPIYLGLATSLVLFVAGSLLGAPTAAGVLREWNARIARGAVSSLVGLACSTALLLGLLPASSFAAGASVTAAPVSIDACALLDADVIREAIGVPVEPGLRRDVGVESNGAYSSACVWTLSTAADFRDDPTAPLGGKSFVIVNALRWPNGPQGARSYLDAFRLAKERGELTAPVSPRRLGDEALWWGDGLAVRRHDVSFGISVFTPHAAASTLRSAAGPGEREAELARSVLQRLAAADAQAPRSKQTMRSVPR